MSYPAALIVIDAAICAVIVLRLVFYRRRGARYRPVASLVAYVVAVAAGWVTILAIAGHLSPPDPASVVLHGVLAVALLAARGNVVEIFHTAEYDNCVYRWLRKGFHHDQDTAQG